MYALEASVAFTNPFTSTPSGSLHLHPPILHLHPPTFTSTPPRTFPLRKRHAPPLPALSSRNPPLMPFTFAHLVGTYRLVLTPELVAFIERTFVEPARPADRDHVRRAALEEARLAELVVEPDGTIVSRAGAQEFYRVRASFDDRAYERFELEKAPGMPVALVL